MLRRRGIKLLIAILSIFMLSCAKRKPPPAQLFESGLTYCDGQIGQFDVILTRSKQDINQYILKVVTVALPTDHPAGIIARVAIANQRLEYVILVGEIQLQLNQVVFQDYVYESDLNKYNRLVIAEFDPNDPNRNSFLQGNAKTDAICSLPDRVPPPVQ